MKRLAISWITVAWLPLMIFLDGCSREAAPPATISADQLPSVVERAFVKANPELKQSAARVAELLRASNYTKAYAVLGDLAEKPGLSKEQRRIVASALLTVNGLLQTAVTQGDAQAAKTLNYIRENK